MKRYDNIAVVTQYGPLAEKENGKYILFEDYQKELFFIKQRNEILEDAILKIKSMSDSLFTNGTWDGGKKIQDINNLVRTLQKSQQKSQAQVLKEKLQKPKSLSQALIEKIDEKN
jgi:hypothetical protein